MKMAKKVTKWLCLDRRYRLRGGPDFKTVSAVFSETPRQLRLVESSGEVQSRLGYGTIFSPDHADFHDTPERAIAHRIESLKKTQADLALEIEAITESIKQVEQQEKMQ